jgi:hypothetical protein
VDNEGDGNNNKKVMKLFGHPNLVRLPNRIQGQDLYAAVDHLVPYLVPYSILLVDGQVSPEVCLLMCFITACRTRKTLQIVFKLDCDMKYMKLFIYDM